VSSRTSCPPSASTGIEIAFKLVPTERALNADRSRVAERLATLLSTGYDPRGAWLLRCRQRRHEVPDLSVEVGGCEVSHATNYRSAMPRVWSFVRNWPAVVDAC
jgi:hypothetical protein